jgi:antitoxin Phd
MTMVDSCSGQGARRLRPGGSISSQAGVSSYCTILLSVLYTMRMATMAISEARERLAEAVETAHTEAVFLERYGQPAAVLVSPERYEEMMEALEDAEDVAAFDSSMAEEGPNIPWEQVKADLGWM